MNILVFGSKKLLRTEDLLIHRFVFFLINEWLHTHIYVYKHIMNTINTSRIWYINGQNGQVKWIIKISLTHLYNGVCKHT